VDQSTTFAFEAAICGLSAALLISLLVIFNLRKQVRLIKSVISVDVLTGALTRLEYERVIRSILRRTSIVNEKTGLYGRTTLLVLELDGFKTVNDTYGHPAGDAVLREAVERMKGVVRHTDFVFRIGGDEFVIVLPDTDCEGAMHVAKRIYDSFGSRPVMLRNGEAKLAASIGGSCISGELVKQLGDHRAEECVYYSADAAMYAAKLNKGTDDERIVIRPAST